MALSTAHLSVEMDIDTKQQFIKDVIAECKNILAENPGNRCVKYCLDYLNSDEGKNLDSKGEITIITKLFVKI